MLKIKHLKIHIQVKKNIGGIVECVTEKEERSLFPFFCMVSNLFFRQVFRKPMQKLNQKTNKKTTTRLCFIIKTCETETMASIFLLPLLTCRCNVV